MENEYVPRTLSDMLRAMNRVTGFDRYELTGKCREHILCFSRYCLWRALRDAGWSYPKIGRELTVVIPP